ncbi:MAG: hypothetical protein Q9210_003137 [Variospora velana]
MIFSFAVFLSLLLGLAIAAPTEIEKREFKDAFIINEYPHPFTFNTSKGKPLFFPDHCPENDPSRFEYPLKNPIFDDVETNRGPGSERVVYYWAPGDRDHNNVPIVRYCGVITHEGMQANGFRRCKDDEDMKREKEKEKKRKEEEEKKRKEEEEEEKRKEEEEKKRKEEDEKEKRKEEEEKKRKEEEEKKRKNKKKEKKRKEEERKLKKEEAKRKFEEEKRRREEEEKKKKEEDEKKKKEEDEKKKKKEEDEKKTTRSEFCLKYTAVDEPADTYNLDDLIQAAKEYPYDVHYEEGELTESNISPKHQELKPEPATVAGYPAEALFDGLIPSPRKRSPAKSGSRRGGRGPTGADGKPVKPADKGSDQSKKTIQGFKEQQAYRDCFTRTAGTKTKAGAELKFDGVPPGGFIADDAEELITVRLCGEKDCVNRGSFHEHEHTWGSYADAMNRPDRIEMNKCIDIGQELDLDKQVSAFEVISGCCVFYKEFECKAENAAFSAVDREDMYLKGDANDVMRSFMCNHVLCEGIPGSKPG